jgi:hypothetical protein
MGMNGTPNMESKSDAKDEQDERDSLITKSDENQRIEKAKRARRTPPDNRYVRTSGSLFKGSARIFAMTTRQIKKEGRKVSLPALSTVNEPLFRRGED